MAKNLPARCFNRVSAGAGAKGERDYDWAWVRITPPADETTGHHWLLIRRNLTNGELAFYRCWSATPVSEMPPSSNGSMSRSQRSAPGSAQPCPPYYTSRATATWSASSSASKARRQRSCTPTFAAPFGSPGTAGTRRAQRLRPANLARTLVVADVARTRTVDTAIGWHGTLTDEQARIFATQLYTRLSIGDDVQDCFDPAHLIVAATWPDQAEPYLNGDGSLVPFPRGRHQRAPPR